MIPENEIQPTAPEEKGASRRLSRQALLLILLGVAVLALAIYGSLRIRHLEQRVDRFSRQAEESVKKVEAVSERSEEALIRASQAEENALQAAHARELAERARAEFERIAESARQEAQVAREEVERVRKEREAELDRMQKALSQIAETRRTALGLVMNLGEDTLRFDFDKATLRPENRELLSRIAGVLLTSRGYRIDVFGHTDDIGTEEYNLRLSQRRAQSVRNYLVEAGVDPEIISTKGFGKSSPRAPGTAPAARAANRRVEIAIVDSVIEMLGPARGRKK
ncbi:MAG TPA: OmpA family protein [Terriglobia bacterium]|nr:OmpA family protein [Terriglobia bacterium]